MTLCVAGSSSAQLELLKKRLVLPAVFRKRMLATGAAPAQTNFVK